MSNVLLISVSGEDQPGVTNAVTEALAEFGVTLLDIGQAVIHDQLNMGILVSVPENTNVDDVTSEVLQTLDRLNMQGLFLPISNERYENWVGLQGKSRHIVTLLARNLEASHLAAVTEVTAQQGLNIDKIVRLSGRIILGNADINGQACIEFSARGEPNSADELRQSLLKLAGEQNIDIAYQEDNIFRRSRQLVVFDMDSTLIDAEVIDELAVEAGVGEQVAAITEAAMRGEVDFKQSFVQRVALLEGLSEGVLQTVAKRLRLNDGAEYLLKSLNQLGFKTAIVSGGFTFFARHLQKQLGVDYVYANELDVVKGVVTGNVVGEIIDGQRKAEILVEIANKLGLSLEQVIAVGDGANDLAMLNIAGLGIAFRAKPLVKASAKQAISNVGLDGILYLLGYSDKDIVNLHKDSVG
ncbi:MAG: Phosphoserine phosphatase SerB2 [Porticoccaceae bacterium UBA1117]|nr:MAG: Phosphoserine phosphatase SerB2 [Porticoccaceae bacterium UBA1117]